MPNDAEQLTDRELADRFNDAVSQAREEINGRATAEELEARTTAEEFADAQLDALTAILHEIRHGNEQQAAHTAALHAHTKALKEHTEVMGDLAAQLLGNADALNRSRR